MKSLKKIIEEDSSQQLFARIKKNYKTYVKLPNGKVVFGKAIFFDKNRNAWKLDIKWDDGQRITSKIYDVYVTPKNVEDVVANGMALRWGY